MYDDEIQGFLIVAAVAAAAYLGVNIFVAWSVIGLSWEICANLLFRGLFTVLILAVIWVTCGAYEKSRFCYFTSSVLAMTWYCWWPAIKKSAEIAPCFHGICNDYDFRWWGQTYTTGVGAFLLILAASLLATKAWENRY